VPPEFLENGLVPNSVVREQWPTDTECRDLRSRGKRQHTRVRVITDDDAWSSVEPPIAAGFDHGPHVTSTMRRKKAESQHIFFPAQRQPAQRFAAELRRTDRAR